MRTKAADEFTLDRPLNLTRSGYIDDPKGGKAVFIYSTAVDGFNDFCVAEVKVCNMVGLTDHQVEQLTCKIAATITPKETRHAVEARVRQEWKWGNLTKLGVLNHLTRGGWRSEAARDLAEKICV